MDVRIREARTDGGNDLRELSRGDSLGSWTEDIRGGDLAGDGTHFQRAGLGGRDGHGRVAEVGAQEEADPTGGGTLAEVDVRLLHVREAAIAQLPPDQSIVFADLGFKFSRSRRRKRERCLLEAGKRHFDLFGMSGEGHCARDSQACGGCKCLHTRSPSLEFADPNGRMPICWKNGRDKPPRPFHLLLKRKAALQSSSW